MRSMAFYGKGGSGKTTVSTSLTVLLAMEGHKILLLGCDPKHDTTYALVERSKRVTLVTALQKAEGVPPKPESFVMHGTHGIDCVEAGGPEPGVGCAGRGITLMLEVLSKQGMIPGTYDDIVYDVLGDVVCGGFAAPIRSGFAQEVYIIVSGEVLSLYAANNLCKALDRYKSAGVRLAGLVPNLRGVPGEEELLLRFAELLGTRTYTSIPRDAAVHQAHVMGRTVVEAFPESKAAKALVQLKNEIFERGFSLAITPTPLSDEVFEEFVQTAWARPVPTSTDGLP